ncbi:polysaccharide export protein [Sphingomonas sp. CFBP 13603]|uniref:polysaccharide biosynthesis/export family protein n=1 Tax=Sphingomonas sp. CFBP 13603 TaxID=2774040 RepID=UPI00186850B7|nr:polysaccharide biosynthesis/export family protein [Sphingomonas sp. CFBP 13603]MBE2992979.1 polysaccharide export protein [Sphingomonas sp. CFBP 13603]
MSRWMVARMIGCQLLSKRKILLGAFVLLVAGCSSGKKEPLGVPAYQPNPITVQVPGDDYRIGPRDTLSVKVLGEPDLTLDEQAVSLAGNLSMPLLGQVPAAGHTVEEVAQAITRGLNSRYLRNASVAVAVVKAIGYSFTVEGQVQKPGVYEIPGRISLMQAVALSSGFTADAEVEDVIVIRRMNGQQYAARFNVEDIRYGRYPDPEIKQSDLIVVGISRRSRFSRNLISALPGLAAVAGVFLAFR